MYPANLKITSELAQPDSKRTDELVEILNKQIQPPKKLSKEEVHIRVMYIVSDAINSYGGCFPLESLEEVKNLIIGAPVLVGHRKDLLPIARNFNAEFEEKEGQFWVKAYFYWLADTKNADELKRQIDGGIYKECSIGFTFLLPECSICHKDIRGCRHTPLEEYKLGARKQLCFFYYKQIDQVLETSLVYRGANPDTSISDKLSSNQNNYQITKISDLKKLTPMGNYLVMPAYEGLLLKLEAVHETLGDIDQAKIYEELGVTNQPELTGMLIGFRGKERCSRKQLVKYLKEHKGPVKRLEFRYFPQQEKPVKKAAGNHLLKPIKYRLANLNQLPAVIDEVKTKEGVLLAPLSTNNLNHIFHYIPGNERMTSVKLSFLPSYHGCRLDISNGSEPESYLFKNFKLNDFMAGRRMIAEKASSVLVDKSHAVLSSCLLDYREDNQIVQMQLSGDITGLVSIQPLIYRNQNLFMIRLKSTSTNSSREVSFA